MKPPAVFAVSEAAERLDPETIRIAQELRHAGRTSVGLLPASREVVLWPFALGLGLALARLGEGRIALVDVELAWPDLEPMPGAAETKWEDLFVGTMPLGPNVELLRPLQRAPEGGRVPLLEVTLQRLADQSPPYTERIIDLAGFLGRPGEFLAALDAVGGILVVARAGRTRDRDLANVLSSVPSAQNLGVVLVR